MAGADHTSTFAVALQDQVSGPANAAAGAIEKLREKLDADQKALKSHQSALARLKAGGLGSSETAKQLKTTIAGLKTEVASSTKAIIELGGSFQSTARAAKTTEDAVSKASGGIGDLFSKVVRVPGPIGAITQRLAGLVGGAGAAVIAIGAVVFVLAAIVGAALRAAVSFGQYALAQADAVRSERLHLEGLLSLDRGIAKTATSARVLQGAIDRVSSGVALGRADVARYAEALTRAGLRGGALSEALEGVAIVASVQGDTAASAFQRQAVAASRAGRSVRALADDVRNRLGGIARRQLLSFDAQAAKLRENLALLFGDLKIDQFLEGLSTITELFSQNTASGRALKTLVEVLLQPLIDGLTAAFPVARRFFQGLIIGALLFTRELLRLRNRFIATFGGSDVLGGIDVMKTALIGGVLVFGALAVALTVTVASLAVVAGALVLTGLAIARLIEWGSKARASFGALGASFQQFGKSVVDGFVNGLLAGQARVLGAVRTVASGATDALRDALGIRSPSRVFAQLGVQIPRGLAEGVDTGAAAARASVAELVDAPTAPTSRSVSARSSVTIAELHVHTDSSAPRDLASSVRDALAEALAGLAVEMGAPA